MTPIKNNKIIIMTSFAAFIGGVAVLCLMLIGVSTRSAEATPKAPTDVVRPQADFTKGHANALAPHKAVYDISTTKIHSGSPIVNTKGRMTYEWVPDCEGWLSVHKFDLIYEYAEGSPMRMSSNFSTYESYDGKGFSYVSQRRRNGETVKNMRGFVKEDENRIKKAVFTEPENLLLELPDNTIYPMGHTLGVLDAILNKKSFYHATIFDGSDDKGPVDVNVFIGKPMAVSNLTGSGMDAALLGSPAHRIRLAFFPQNDDTDTSEYEMDITFHENGIISDMMVEYDDFTVHQKLTALEKLPVSCQNKGGE